MPIRNKVLDLVFDLFVELNATDEQLDFPIIYASAKDGFAKRELNEKTEDLTPLFEAIVQHVPPPTISAESVSRCSSRISITAIISAASRSGKLSADESASAIRWSAFTATARRERASHGALFTTRASEQVEVKHANAGDIMG